MMQLPCEVERILLRLEDGGHEAWLVGGVVRDALWRQPEVLAQSADLRALDYDIATGARPDEVEQLFMDMRQYAVGKKHGTIAVRTRDGLVEITTFRRDGAYSDRRHPDAVQFGVSIEEDLARRDFTVNAIAWNPSRGMRDPFGGRGDLEKGILRAVGDPMARFQEDGLRILRAVRLCAQHGFVIEPQTWKAMQDSFSCLHQVSAERIASELTWLLCGRYARRVLIAYRECIGAVLPELIPMFDLSQQSVHHRFDVWEHTVEAMSQAPPQPLLRWTMLLHDSGKPACKTVDENGRGHFYGHAKVSRQIAAQIAARLRFGTEQSELLCFLVAHHDNPLGADAQFVRRKLSRIGEERFRLLLSVQKADWYGKRMEAYDLQSLIQTEGLLEDVLAQRHCVSRKMLAVNGDDMVKLGLQGKQIGEMLETLLAAVLEVPESNEREMLLEMAQKRMEEWN